MASYILIFSFLIFVPASFGQLVDPATVKCGESEYTWCDYTNGKIRGGLAPRKCAGKCLCEGHPSFHGDNLDWIDDKCVTTEGYACGESSDGTMFVHCESGTECIGGRCRKPDFPKKPLWGSCKDDVECLEGKCRAHLLYSPPLPLPITVPGRKKRALPPVWCCSLREAEFDETTYTLETHPCKDK